MFSISKTYGSVFHKKKGIPECITSEFLELLDTLNKKGHLDVTSAHTLFPLQVRNAFQLGTWTFLETSALDAGQLLNRQHLETYLHLKTKTELELDFLPPPTTKWSTTNSGAYTK